MNPQMSAFGPPPSSQPPPGWPSQPQQQMPPSSQGNPNGLNGNLPPPNVSNYWFLIHKVFCIIYLIVMIIFLIKIVFFFLIRPHLVVICMLNNIRKNPI